MKIATNISEDGRYIETHISGAFTFPHASSAEIIKSLSKIDQFPDHYKIFIDDSIEIIDGFAADALKVLKDHVLSKNQNVKFQILCSLNAKQYLKLNKIDDWATISAQRKLKF